MLNFLNKVISDTGLLKEIYVDIAQPGVRKVGLALETVLDLSNTILLPVKIANERSKIVLTKNMERYKEKMDKVEETNIAIVPPEIGVPILDKLTYTTNETIAELFIDLLAKASSVETCESAYPRFFHIIDNLSVDEAQVVNYLARNRLKNFPFITFRAKRKGNPNMYYLSSVRLTGIEREANLLYPNNIVLYLNNLVGLGLLDEQLEYYIVDHAEKFTELETSYVESKQSFDQNLSPREIYEDVEVLKGYFQLTEIGKKFISTIASS